ncbi:MarR family transcriptional regulator [Amycolatopsis eburnea]|uniref:MarR family transcriptional regulator n=1 Tax=Amycolatopsis eburnea TaxID=2267691 RepID=A0A3R9F892_9PSEU|nr:MarR family transcriptional regulator [Amycolatopsis eburnea]RSD15557.1 MarR family transcriptional regulator [Amycolatopsis eburnea]
MAALARLFESVLEGVRDVSPRPLSVSQLRAVVALDRRDGINLRELAEQLDSTPPLVSRLCDRLEAVGFLERLPSARSRRELTLRLSDRGRAYLQDLRSRRRDRVEALLAKMTPDGRAALATGLAEYRDLADETPDLHP